MSTHRIILLQLLALAVAACDRRATGRAIDSTRSDPTPTKVAAVPWYLDSAQACGFARVTVYSDPTALVRHYVALDSAGTFLATTPVTDTVYLCPAHLPGPDAFTIVKHSEIRLLSHNDTSARVVVSSVRLGTMTSDSAGNSYLVREAPQLADTFHLVHTAYGWRIEAPQLPDRVSGETVLKRAAEWRVRPDALDSLRAFISRPGV